MYKRRRCTLTIPLFCATVFSIVTILIAVDYNLRISSLKYNVRPIKAMLSNYLVVPEVKEDKITSYSEWTSKSSFDGSENYKIISYLRNAKDWSQLEKSPLCVSLHTSIEKIDQLIKFTDSWNGPASLCIFGSGPEFELTSVYIEYLTQCHTNIAKQISFHFVFPVIRPPSEVQGLNVSYYMDCTKTSKSVLKDLLEIRSYEFLAWKKKILYPHNLLRNVARSHCQSPWFLDIDLDMVFPRPDTHVNPALKSKLLDFLKSEKAEKCQRCAFVLPIFEFNTSVNANIPSDKSELKTLISEEKARTFMSRVFAPSHSATKQDTKWLELPDSKDIKIAYKVDFEFKYEPYIITQRSAPRFDERYMQNGMDRDSWTYEMFLAGYTFQVLDNIFLLHLGYPLSSEFSGDYAMITRENIDKFEALHHRELAAKYDRDPFGLLAEFQNRNHRNYTIQISAKP